MLIHVGKLQMLLQVTLQFTTPSANSKYHKRWYYFEAQWHFGDVLHK